MKKNLNALQAFNAMVDFLEGYYKKTPNDIVGLLLSDMLFLQDGDTADPAVWKIWSKGVNEQILKGNLNIRICPNNTEKILNILQAFDAMVIFFKNYYHLTLSEEAKVFLDELYFLKNGGTADSNVWNEWNKSIAKILNMDTRTRQYLKLSQ